MERLSRLDFSRILIICDRPEQISKQIEMVIGGDLWMTKVEVEIPAKKKIVFETSPEINQLESKNLSIFRWAKDQSCGRTVGSSSKGNTTVSTHAQNISDVITTDHHRMGTDKERANGREQEKTRVGSSMPPKKEEWSKSTDPTQQYNTSFTREEDQRQAKRLKGVYQDNSKLEKHEKLKLVMIDKEASVRKIGKEEMIEGGANPRSLIERPQIERGGSERTLAKGEKIEESNPREGGKHRRLDNCWRQAEAH